MNAPAQTRRNPGTQYISHDRGRWYYFNLATFIQNWALGAFEGFDGDDKFVTNAVELTTIHKAKRLEWPVVFLTSLTASRFPTTKMGQPKTWFVPTKLFDRKRYEGRLNDERRLFYVAITRARDWLSLSAHGRVKKSGGGLCPFLEHLHPSIGPRKRALPLPATIEPRTREDQPLLVTYSTSLPFLGEGCILAI